MITCLITITDTPYQLTPIFFKTIVRITPQYLLSLPIPRNRIYHISTNIGHVSCYMCYNEVYEIKVVIADITFTPACLRIYNLPPVPSQYKKQTYSTPISNISHFHFIKQVYDNVWIIGNSKGKYNYTDGKGNILCGTWFSDYRPFHNCKVGTISFVNISGQCFAFKLEGPKLINMNKSWRDCFVESRFIRHTLEEQLMNGRWKVYLSESSLMKIIAESIRRVLYN